MRGRMQQLLGRPRRQAGAVAIWVGVALVGLLSAAFLAIDTGRLYHAQRDLQRLATLAAVSGAQVASGCAGIGADGSIATLSNVSAAIQSILVANGGQLSMLTGINGFPAVELGKMVPDDGVMVFEPLPVDDPGIGAVRVNLTRPQPTPFIGFLTGGGTLQASATAEQPLVGTFSVGSTLLALNTQNSALLNGVLEGLLCPNPGSAACDASINISALGFQGLAGVKVSLGELATAAGVQSKDLSDVLDLSTQTPILSDLLNGLSGALGDRVSGSTARLLQDLGAAASGNSNPVLLAPLLEGVTTVAGDVPFINLLDLIVALGVAANASEDGSVKPIPLPLSVNVPNVVSSNVFLSIGAPARSASGHAGVTATTAEVTLMTRMSLDILQPLQQVANQLFAARVRLDMQPVKLGTDIQILPSTVRLDRMQCPGIGSPSPVAELSASTGLARVRLGTFAGNASAAPPLLTTPSPLASVSIDLLGGVASAKVQFNLARAVDSSVGNAGFVEFPEPVTEFIKVRNSPALYQAQGTTQSPVNGNPQTLGSRDLLSSTVASLLDTARITASGDTCLSLGNVCVLPIAALLNPLASSLLTILEPVLVGGGGLIDALVDPLLRALGVEVGQATMQMTAIEVGPSLKVQTCIPGGPGIRGCQVPP